MQDLQQGKLNPRQKVKLADDLYRAGGKSEALALFDENLPKYGASEDIPNEAYLNYGTALLDSGRGQEALSVYETLDRNLADSPEAKEIRGKMEKNTLSFFKKNKEKKEQQKKDQEKKNKDNKENKEGEENKDQQNQVGDKKQQGDSGQDKQQKGQSGQQDKKGPDKDGEEMKDQKDQGEEKKDGEGKEDEEKKEPKKESDAEDGQEKKPLPPRKLAPKLKQLMSDDRQLQMRMIEQGTRDLNRKKLRNSKDW